jgi:Sulfotransferase family
MADPPTKEPTTLGRGALFPITWRIRARGPHRVGRDADAPVQGPVVIGGVGGSGTRVVELILRRLGVYTGSDLNWAGDNLWFTLLCKLPRWDLAAFTADSGVMRGLTAVERAMTGRLDFTHQDRRIVHESLHRSRQWWRDDRLDDDKPPAWLRKRLESLLTSRRDYPPDAALWGLKEPNSHHYIGHLQRHFGDRLRYVHVIRNGLHMAQSRNQLQLNRWGSVYGVPDPGGDRSPDPGATASLDYWIRANETAIQEGNALPQGSFLLLNYDDLCMNPKREIDRFVEFLGLHPSADTLEELAGLPKRGSARPRPDYDAREMFGGERLARVRALGFPVESGSTS